MLHFSLFITYINGCPAYTNGCTVHCTQTTGISVCIQILLSVCSICLSLTADGKEGC